VTQPVEAQRVDAHLHLWDLSAGGYAWLTPELGPLYRSFSADQARAELEGCDISSAVLVQAEDSERDTAAMLAVADAHPWVAGVVGWVDLEQPERAEQQLDRWQGHPAFCGVRSLVHDDPRDDLLELPTVRRTLAVLAERGLPFDVPDAWPRLLSDVGDLAAALPDLRIVVDHLAKPPAERESWDDWRRTLARWRRTPAPPRRCRGCRSPAGRSTRRTCARRGRPRSPCSVLPG
jgi:L-fuconolactonase